MLVSAQVALSLVALVGAGLFLRSLQNAQQISPGFDAEHLAVLSFDLGAQGYTEERGRQFQQRVLERAAAVPGVQSGVGREHGAAVCRRLRADGVSRRAGRVGPARRPARADQRRRVAVPRNASASRWCAAGRCPRRDQPNTPIAVVINETMAKRFWPDQDAIGKRFKFFGQDFFNEVVGIAKDSKYNFIGEEADAVHLSGDDAGVSAAAVAVREGGAARRRCSARCAARVQQLDRNLPLTGVFTLTEIFDQALWAPRMARVAAADVRRPVAGARR